MQLHFQKHGTGATPLIILHGLFGMSDNWAAYGKRIAEWGYTVYILDQRNHGRSPHHHVFNYLALTDDLAEFVETQELDNFVLMGHSMGGKVAMRYALENSKQIQKLIVVDISMRAYQAREHHKQVIRMMRDTPLDQMSSREELQLYLRQQMDTERMVQFVLKNLKRTTDGKFAWKLNIEAICDHLDQMFDAISAHTPFHQPSLFIRGGNSDYVSDQDIEQIKISFPNSEVHTVPHASHWVHVDQAQTFQEHLYAFLK